MDYIFSAEQAKKAENLGALLPEWLEEIYAQKWFKLFVPQDLDGLELGLTEALKIEERLAKMDGSLGWTVTLCAGAGWFVGFMEEQLRNEVFDNPKVCLAGSGFVGGKAELVPNGYEITGEWTYASGATHATHFTANCEIYEKGKPIVSENGAPIVKAFLLKRAEVEILDSWKYMGMVATGSHAFSAKGLKVPRARCFEIVPDQVKLENPIYRFPFLQFAEATLSANILGITQHLHSLINESFWYRHELKPFNQKQIEFFEEMAKKTAEQLDLFRSEFYSSVDQAESELSNSGFISESSLESLSRICRTMTQFCRESNASLFPFAGLHAADPNSELNRVWRDFYTVSQHSLLTFPF
jgi:hypothetical protein